MFFPGCRYIVIALTALFFQLSWPAVICSRAEKEGKGSLVQVEAVYDGDTVGISTGHRHENVRLIGIDAPEMGQRPWGEKSRSHLEGIISSSAGRVFVEYDVDRRDKFGRMLAYLRTQDGRLVNIMMVEDGYAVLFTIPPNVRHAGRLAEAQRLAREKRLGLWGPKGLRQRPSDYRRENPRQ